MLPDTTIPRPVLAGAFLAASAALMFPAATSSAGVTAPSSTPNIKVHQYARHTEVMNPGVPEGTRASLVYQEQHLLQQARRAKPAVRPRPKPSATPVQPSPSATPSYTPTTAPAQIPPAPVAVSGSPQEYAQSILGQYGWGADQMLCLIPLWERESGWNVYASNPGSGAYGIPQALPGSKMASAGADWATDAATQIRWGLGLYIKPVYGSPCAAWAHEQQDGWY